MKNYIQNGIWCKAEESIIVYNLYESCIKNSWEKIMPMIPKQERKAGKAYYRSPGAGRPPMDMKMVLLAILYVGSELISWKSLPSELGSSSSVHKYFKEWEKAGVFERLFKEKLLEPRLALRLCPVWYQEFCKSKALEKKNNELMAQKMAQLAAEEEALDLVDEMLSEYKQWKIDIEEDKLMPQIIAEEDALDLAGEMLSEYIQWKLDIEADELMAQLAAEEEALDLADDIISKWKLDIETDELMAQIIAEEDTLDLLDDIIFQLNAFGRIY